MKSFESWWQKSGWDEMGVSKSAARDAWNSSWRYSYLSYLLTISVAVALLWGFGVIPN